MEAANDSLNYAGPHPVLYEALGPAGRVIPQIQEIRSLVVLIFFDRFFPAATHSQMMATQRVHAAEALANLIGRTETVKP